MSTAGSDESQKLGKVRLRSQKDICKFPDDSCYLSVSVCSPRYIFSPLSLHFSRALCKNLDITHLSDIASLATGTCLREAQLVGPLAAPTQHVHPQQVQVQFQIGRGGLSAFRSHLTMLTVHSLLFIHQVTENKHRFCCPFMYRECYF